MARHIDIERLSKQLASICECAEKLESDYAQDLEAVHPKFRDSARNLVHYLALRQSDVGEFQEDLATLGLSSLGRAERNVLGSVRAVRTALKTLSGDSGVSSAFEMSSLQLHSPAADAHKNAILGEQPDRRDVRIMVTLPVEAAQNRELVVEMIVAGMNVARINCAHDDHAAWQAMIENVRAASAELEKDCRIIMDLAGPKLRTGALLPGPKVMHLRPRRGPMGRVRAPRRVRLIPDDVLWHGSKAAVIPVSRECIELASEGDALRFKDTRGKKRLLTIVSKDAKGIVAETYKGAYVATGTKLRLIRQGAGEKLDYYVGELPHIDRPLRLRSGDTLILHENSVPGEPAINDAEGNIITPAHISCQQPEVFQFVMAGDRISLNDGKIAGVVRGVDDDQLEVEITKAKPTGNNLRADRGINFPDSDIRLPGMTELDKKNLQFVVENADAVSLSFVREPDDITQLQEELRKYPNNELGIVIKVETKRGFKNLPRVLLRAMRSYPAAVMIARGDLAVECGWERLAELQEEILWFCEAAQVPVMWATQVLEQEAKKGQPSRAEISDAAMAQRADCVMLNKGPHILAAIRMLDNILRRMQKHQFKKTARMKKLSSFGETS